MTELFEPGKIAGLTLANRLVRSATAEYMADKAGRPEPPLVEMYEALARGGVGLIVTGSCRSATAGGSVTRMP
jgi:2,4-dienoyl-CoA reductase-like NADH-dependent reductase (Old Yellow Enzyme family)